MMSAAMPAAVMVRVRIDFARVMPSPALFPARLKHGGPAAGQRTTVKRTTVKRTAGSGERPNGENDQIRRTRGSLPRYQDAGFPPRPRPDLWPSARPPSRLHWAIFSPIGKL